MRFLNPKQKMDEELRKLKRKLECMEERMSVMKDENNEIKAALKRYKKDRLIRDIPWSQLYVDVTDVSDVRYDFVVIAHPSQRELQKLCVQMFKDFHKGDDAKPSVYPCCYNMDFTEGSYLELWLRAIVAAGYGGQVIFLLTEAFLTNRDCVKALIFAQGYHEIRNTFHLQLMDVTSRDSDKDDDDPNIHLIDTNLYPRLAHLVKDQSRVYPVLADDFMHSDWVICNIMRDHANGHPYGRTTESWNKLFKHSFMRDVKGSSKLYDYITDCLGKTSPNFDLLMEGPILESSDSIFTSCRLPLCCTAKNCFDHVDHATKKLVVDDSDFTGKKDLERYIEISRKIADFCEKWHGEWTTDSFLSVKFTSDFFLKNKIHAMANLGDIDKFVDAYFA